MFHDNKYKVFNLCAERSYSDDKFDGNFQAFPFNDHRTPPFELIYAFCESANKFLSMNKDNVIIVHCKAGKGRTGLMICCYLLFSNYCKTACEALNLFALKRTHNKKGVTIPSQRRYVHYFETFLPSISKEIFCNVYNPPCVILIG
ncbi:hypothetical protein HZS_2179, partial [Henneguya salminicola]